MREGTYEASVVGYDATTGVITAVVPQLFGSQPQIITPFVARAADIARITPVALGDRVRIYFPGSDDSPPKWIPAVRDYYAAMGIVGVGSTLGNPIAVPTSGWIAATSAISYTTSVGRRYKFVFVCRAFSAGVNTPGSLRTAIFYDTVDSAGAGITLGDHYWPSSTNYGGITFELYFDGTGVARNYVIGVSSASGVAINAWPTQWWLEDAGANLSISPAAPPVYAAVPWAQLPLISPWANYGSSWSTPGYRKIGDVVSLRGLVGGSAASSGLFATLPAGCRPLGNEVLTGWVEGAGATARTAARVTVGSDGSLTYETTYGPSSPAVPLPINHLSLSGLSFSTS